MATFEADAKDIARQLDITVKLRGLARWKVRAWLGVQLIRLAAWIMWVNVEFDDGEGDPVCPICLAPLLPFTSDTGPFRRGYVCDCMPEDVG